MSTENNAKNFEGLRCRSFAQQFLRIEHNRSARFADYRLQRQEYRAIFRGVPSVRPGQLPTLPAVAQECGSLLETGGNLSTPIG